jgi:penicillin-binding protein 1A
MPPGDPEPLMKKNRQTASPLARMRAYFERKDNTSEFVKYALYGGLFTCTVILVSILLLSPTLPGFDQLERIYEEQSLSTIIYSDDGEVLQATARKGRRMWLPYSAIPKVMIDAVISAEDTRFYKHWGVSLPDIARAMMRNVTGFGIHQGGSTITQQLARDQWLTRKQTIYRKVQEALLAIKIEHTYSKPEILELFLNRMFFGSNYYGIEAASRGYFGHPASELTVGEAALLAGVLKGPSIYNPRSNPKLSEERRNTVLKMMTNSGAITNEEARAEMDIPVEVVSLAGNEYGKAPNFVDYVYDQLVGRYGQAGLDSLGLKIHTTLDYQLQKAAEVALAKQLDSIQKNYADRLTYRRPAGMSPAEAHRDSLARKTVQGALVAMDVRTGAILAMVGGRSYDRTNQYNRAIQAVRQAGSSFKPFVFSAALDNGWKCSDTIYDTYFAMRTQEGTVWAPENFESTFSGTAMTLRYGMKMSINSISVKLVNDVNNRHITPELVASYASKMGITTPIHPYPSIAIGTVGVKLIDITTAYCVFPNLGVRVSPFCVKEIQDKNNNQIFHGTEGKKAEALNRETASLMVTMLQSVCQSGTAANIILQKGMQDRPAGGKTGTGNDFKDAWFIGFTPYICCGVWVGFDSEESTLNTTYGTGATAALPVWVDFMKEASSIRGYPKTSFQLSDRLTTMRLCSETNLRATEYCPQTYEEYFVKGTEPTQYCTVHSRGGAPSPGARPFSQPGGQKPTSRGF